MFWLIPIKAPVLRAVAKLVQIKQKTKYFLSFFIKMLIFFRTFAL